MTKNDWIKVVEKCFKEIDFQKNLNCTDGDSSALFPVPANSRVFILDASQDDNKTITILTKNIVDQEGSPHLFWGEYIIIQSEIETCIIGGSLGVSFIPWTEITVIASS